MLEWGLSGDIAWPRLGLRGPETGLKVDWGRVGAGGLRVSLLGLTAGPPEDRLDSSWKSDT